MKQFSRWLTGRPRDAADPAARRGLLLTTVLASAGLGANGLSSACYGPEKAFLALGDHPELGPILALAAVATLAVLALAYTQIIELFPSGGGNYKIVSQLLGPRMGMIAGAALLVDYMLTIAVSLASGTDALFSLFPSGAQAHKLAVEADLILLLITLNIHGVSAAIRFLLPIRDAQTSATARRDTCTYARRAQACRRTGRRNRDVAGRAGRPNADCLCAHAQRVEACRGNGRVAWLARLARMVHGCARNPRRSGH
ncbi:amino acid permease [Paraburkholderia youngii]|nr:amino acid permease [Paraburkholderia youngii]